MSDFMKYVPEKILRKEWVIDPPSFLWERFDDKIRNTLMEINYKYLIKAKNIEVQIAKLVHELNNIDLQRTEEIAKHIQIRG